MGAVTGARVKNSWRTNQKKRTKTTKVEHWRTPGGAKMMETNINTGNRAVNRRVMSASCSLTRRAMTWWNTRVQARDREATIGMTRDNFKTLLKEEYYSNNEM